MTYAKFVNSFYDMVDVVNLERLIFFYKYPKFTRLCQILLILFAITFSASYLLSYIFALFITVFVLKNEYCYSLMGPIFDKLFFNKTNMYFNETKAHQIKTIRQDTYEKNTVTIRNYAATDSE
jgi:hypothetical protein